MITIVLGTRPEIIKFTPIVEEFVRRGIEFEVFDTEQQKNKEMKQAFYEEFGWKKEWFTTRSRNARSGKRRDLVLVEGDTDSVRIGVIAAKKQGLKVGHIEAGLRSYWSYMKEEVNRIVADHLSDFLFCPVERNVENLKREGVRGKIFLVGNTIADIVRRFEVVEERQGFLLLTLHRPENVDEKDKLKFLLDTINHFAEEVDMKVLLPIHPRLKDKLKKLKVNLPPRIFGQKAVSYRRFIRMLRACDLVLTDSGGVQEESCILGVPCVTLRDNTERQETLEIGSNILAGTDCKREIWLAMYRQLYNKNRWRHPYGKNVGKKIVDILERSS